MTQADRSPRPLSGGRSYRGIGTSWRNRASRRSRWCVPAAAAAIASQCAAMPSLHLGRPPWRGETVNRPSRRTWAQALALACPIVTASVLLGSANHCRVDVLAGAGLWTAAEVVVPQASPVGPS